MSRLGVLVVACIALCAGIVTGWSARASKAEDDAMSLKLLYQPDNEVLRHDIALVGFAGLTLRALEKERTDVAREFLIGLVTTSAADMDQLLARGARPYMLLVDINALEKARDYAAAHGLDTATVAQLERSVATLRQLANK